MFAYCRNNPASRIDISGTADEVCYNNNGEIFDNNDLTGLDGGGGMKSTYVSGVTNHSNGGNGTGSMIGDIAYIDAKAAATTYIPTWGWEEVFAFISSLFSGQSSNHSQCFVEGTLVQTAEGTTAIENIEVGDYVWAWDEESGDVALKEVVETYVNQTCELIHVFVNGEEIVTTPEHPFYSPVKGWTTAVHLRAGDILVLVNGEYVVVEKIQHEILESPVKVYNFQVEGYHTYYVTDFGVLVHNDCAPHSSSSGFNGDQRALLQLAKEHRNGVSASDANILVEWANEYGISNHGPMIHSGRSGIWSNVMHIKIKNIHIPIFVEEK